MQRAQHRSASSEYKENTRTGRKKHLGRKKAYKIVGHLENELFSSISYSVRSVSLWSKAANLTVSFSRARSNIFFVKDAIH